MIKFKKLIYANVNIIQNEKPVSQEKKPVFNSNVKKQYSAGKVARLCSKEPGAFPFLLLELLWEKYAKNDKLKKICW